MAKRGRPKIIIDLNLVKSLAGIQCTIKEISAVMNIPASSLTSRPDFSLVYKNGLENGKASLRRIQFRMAETSPAMAIWLGKQYLGQNEKIEVTNTELMKEELELIPNNHKSYDYKNRLAKFVNN